MEIHYSQHLENRIHLRHIDYALPKRVFLQATQRYYDTETGYFIAICEIQIYGKQREIMVAYEIEESFATLVTIHPLKEGQREKRLQSGRWRLLP